MKTTATIESPIGDLVLVHTDGVLSELHMREPVPSRQQAPPGFEQVIHELDEYFRGERIEFTVPIAPTGSEFQMRVWEQLLRIPYGETRSYGEIARGLGDPGLAREVGWANARNPIAIIVPCHRVIGSDGSLTGYAGGLDRKRHLLDLESGRRSLFAAITSR
ncbi:MAG TPA: methylated-DNA--[protein]-cysteine S-methyltransferase [Actinomycetota bacterium]|jgi:methylated-DNA-[protein]-cysteine S-methyltransferase|nr:methylated-DNA--[protein]-cysteine S-methyltransferase [Actinomycetota bacterium]